VARATAGRWLLFAPFAVVGAIQVASKLGPDGPLDHVSKALCLPLLAAAALGVLLVERRRPAPATVALLGLGLLASWLGDVLIEGSFVLGLAAFLAAHLLFIAMFSAAFRRRASWWALLAIPWYLALIGILAPGLGGLLVPVLVYGAALGTMVAFSTRGGMLTTVGGILFAASDTMIALQEFTPYLAGRVTDVPVMLTYLAAQSLLVLGVLSRLVAWPMASSSGSAPGTSRTRRSRASRSPG